MSYIAQCPDSPIKYFNLTHPTLVILQDTLFFITTEPLESVSYVENES